MKNLKAETRQGEQRNAQCFAERNNAETVMMICEGPDLFGCVPPTYMSRGISPNLLYLLSNVDWPPD